MWLLPLSTIPYSRSFAIDPRRGILLSEARRILDVLSARRQSTVPENSEKSANAMTRRETRPDSHRECVLSREETLQVFQV